MTKFYKNCDHQIKFDRVRDLSNAYLNSGTCTFDITKDADGSSVASGTVSYVTSSDGKYLVVLDKVYAANVVVYERYTLKVTFEGTGGQSDERYVELEGAKRN